MKMELNYTGAKLPVSYMEGRHWQYGNLESIGIETPVWSHEYGDGALWLTVEGTDDGWWESMFREDEVSILMDREDAIATLTTEVLSKEVAVMFHELFMSSVNELVAI